MSTLSGPITTAAGLVFYSGTQDYYLRAFDVHTGKELWKGRLPVGAQATPMTYVSPQSGRHFVFVSAGGARLRPDRGTLVAYQRTVQTAFREVRDAKLSIVAFAKALGGGWNPQVFATSR